MGKMASTTQTRTRHRLCQHPRNGKKKARIKAMRQKPGEHKGIFMDVRMRELVREVLDEIGLIKARKARVPKSLAEAKGDLKDASHIANRLYGFGPNISDRELEQFGTALLELNATPKESLPQLQEYDRARHQEAVDKFMQKFHGQFQTVATRTARARARLTIAALARKGLSLDQI